MSEITKRPGAAFDCWLCEHCCRGKGGIVVSGKDRDRLCAFLACARKILKADTGSAGTASCSSVAMKRDTASFSRERRDAACTRPSRTSARAWPYFKGNLVDSGSLELAKDFCPGISQGQFHGQFVEEGLSYLLREKLVGGRKKDEAEALQVADLLDARACTGNGR